MGLFNISPAVLIQRPNLVTQKVAQISIVLSTDEVLECNALKKAECLPWNWLLFHFKVFVLPSYMEVESPTA